jgi:hypothetical protein
MVCKYHHQYLDACLSFFKPNIFSRSEQFFFSATFIKVLTIYPNETLLYKECIVSVLKMLQLQTKFEFGRKWQKRLAGTVRGEILGFENKKKVTQYFTDKLCSLF